jgi:A/G-specific adenine glycosylase
VLRGAELRSFRKKLLSWFDAYQRDLPWRHAKDPYRIWLSEIMLQQTRVAAVIPYYQRFLRRFPDIRALATAPEEEVLRMWAGLGYYSRARNLQRAAQEVVAKHGGKFPRSYADVLTLSGIGDYTAAAVLSIAFGARYAVLDGNVARVLARIQAIKGDLRESRRRQMLRQTADELLDRERPGDWNQAMMELGAVVCTPRAPQCLVCPVASHCEARKLGIADSLPAPTKKPAIVEVTLAAAVFVDTSGSTVLLGPDRVAIRKAAHDDVATLVSGMWHFPTVAVKRDALVEMSSLLKELSWKKRSAKAFVLEPLAKVRHTVTYRRITILTFRAPVAKLPQVTGSKAISLEELASRGGLATSSLTRKIALAALSRDCSPRPEGKATSTEGSLLADKETMATSA